MHDIQLSFTLSEKDYSEATSQKSASVEGSGSRLWLSILILIVALYGTWFVADWLVPPQMEAPEPLLKRMILGAAPWAYVVGWFYYIVKGAARHDRRAAWRMSPLSHMPREVHLADGGLTSKHAFDTTHYQWGGFLRLAESPHLLLLFTSINTLVMLPKRAFPDGTDFVELRRWLAGRMNPFSLSPEAFAASQADEGAPPLMPQLQFRLTVGDFAMAERADTRKRGTRAVWDYAIWPVAFAAAYLLVGWMAERTAFAGGVSPIWVFIATFIAYAVIQVTLRLRRWRNAGHLHGQQTVDVTEEGLKFRSAGATQWTGWGAIIQCRRAKKVFVIHLRDETMRIIPLRAFMQPESASELERLARERVLPTAGFAVVSNTSNTAG